MKETIFSIPYSEWGTAQEFEFIVTYLIPILTCIFLIFGGVWTVYKYFNEKNRNFYSSILESVYEPLFHELVKNEYSRKLMCDAAESKNERKKFKVNEIPFIIWKGERKKVILEIGKTTSNIENYEVYDFNQILESISTDEKRLKYAPRDLVALIESYFFLERLKGAPTYEDEKIKIQKHIRRNVIIGYKKYRRKLGLKDVSINKFCYSWFGWIFFR